MKHVTLDKIHLREYKAEQAAKKQTAKAKQFNILLIAVGVVLVAYSILF